MAKFWMVWMEKGSPPTKRHDTYESALDEAKRIAGKTDNEVFVLVATTRIAAKREYDVTPLEG